jgi:hypothetical protein
VLARPKRRPCRFVAAKAYVDTNAERALPELVRNPSQVDIRPILPHLVHGLLYQLRHPDPIYWRQLAHGILLLGFQALGFCPAFRAPGRNDRRQTDERDESIFRPFF